MNLVLSKSFDTEQTYHLKLNEVVISTYHGNNLVEIIEAAKRWAKNYQKDLVLCKSAVAEYFIGFQKSFKNPVIFKDEDFILSNHIDKHAILEGPYADINEAQKACFSLSGEKGEVIELRK